MLTTNLNLKDIITGIKDINANNIIRFIDEDNFEGLLDELLLLNVYNKHIQIEQEIHKEIYTFTPGAPTKEMQQYKEIYTLQSQVMRDVVNNYVIPHKQLSNFKIAHYATLKLSFNIITKLLELGIDFSVVTIDTISNKEYTAYLLTSLLPLQNSNQEKNLFTLTKLLSQNEFVSDCIRSTNSTFHINSKTLKTNDEFFEPIYSNKYNLYNKYYNLISARLDESLIRADILHKKYSKELYNHTDHLELQLLKNSKFNCAIDVYLKDGAVNLAMLFKQQDEVLGPHQEQKYSSDEFTLLYKFLANYTETNIFATNIDKYEVGDELISKIFSDSKYLIKYNILDTKCSFVTYYSELSDHTSTRYIAATLTTKKNGELLSNIINFLHNTSLTELTKEDRDKLLTKIKKTCPTTFKDEILKNKQHCNITFI